jgi:hypothetical protein
MATSIQFSHLHFFAVFLFGCDQQWVKNAVELERWWSGLCVFGSVVVLVEFRSPIIANELDLASRNFWKLVKHLGD